MKYTLDEHIKHLESIVPEDRKTEFGLPLGIISLIYAMMEYEAQPAKEKE